jgi:hypothetical protein
MKNMRFRRMSNGGYLTPLEEMQPQLAATIKNYRQRLTDAERKTFDKRADIQYKATLNMPKAERSAYIASINKQFGTPSDKQFESLRSDLKSERFRPTYRFAVAKPSESPKTGFYRDYSDDIKKIQDDISKLTITESKKKTVPVYSYYEGRSRDQGLPGSRPGVARTTTKIPEGSTFSPASQQGFVGTPAGYISPSGVRYTQQGTKKITETTTRPQRAGDAEYDKQMNTIARLQKRQRAAAFAPNYTAPSLTRANVYQQLGMAKDGGLKEDIKKIKSKKFSKGGKAAIRGTKFKGVF